MDQVLVKVDRASMMNSLEVRAPFLDTRIVDSANHMPSSFKFRGLERKYILKKCMEGKLPRDIIYRTKKGFVMPIGAWIQGGLKPLILDVLGKKSIEQMGLFDAVYIETIVSDHMSGAKDNRKQIWTLLMFGLWWRRWME
jgi:asparagine synthase (glutamine-hydrolysing)